MPLFLAQFAYSPAAWSTFLKTPQDPAPRLQKRFSGTSAAASSDYITRLAQNMTDLRSSKRQMKPPPRLLRSRTSPQGI